MNRKRTAPVPEAITQLQRQLDQFRSTQPRRTKLPESLGGVAILRRKATKPAFVELIAPQEECVIEFEAPSGNKMRVQWKASTPRDWAS